MTHRLLCGRSERGASLVEAAIVFPLVALLLGAIVDGGVFFSSYGSLGNATRSAARAISIGANNSSADYQGLQAIKANLPKVDGATLERIVIFRANDFNSTEPDSCKTGLSNVSADCNVYLPSDLDRPESDFEGPSWSAPTGWLPTDRDISRSGGTDLVGVSITASLSTPMGLFGAVGHSVTKTAIVQLEASEP